MASPPPSPGSADYKSELALLQAQLETINHLIQCLERYAMLTGQTAQRKPAATHRRAKRAAVAER